MTWKHNPARTSGQLVTAAQWNANIVAATEDAQASFRRARKNLEDTLRALREVNLKQPVARQPTPLAELPPLGGRALALVGSIV